jgi:hypothetical protein
MCLYEHASYRREQHFHALDTAIADIEVVDWGACFMVYYGMPLPDGLSFACTFGGCGGNVGEAVK